MALTFYYGSGSPFAWKVWLALEFKAIPYEAKRLSFDAEETKTPEFLAINPRGRVPTIVDGGFALYESNAICEYLDEQYPVKPLLPKGAQQRAVARRMINEADNYLYPPTGELMEAVLHVKPAERDQKRIDAAKSTVNEELKRWAAMLKGDYLAGDLGLADFAAYPYMRMPMRVEERAPGFGLKREDMPAAVAAWIKRIEALPYFEKTIPPHWKG
ncbi:MAG TPA: glutathione S-transferase family protein [Dongiaceae bacterium]|jgi:glutathione S-transferase